MEYWRGLLPKLIARVLLKGVIDGTFKGVSSGSVVCLFAEGVTNGIFEGTIAWRYCLWIR